MGSTGFLSLEVPAGKQLEIQAQLDFWSSGCCHSSVAQEPTCPSVKSGVGSTGSAGFPPQLPPLLLFVLLSSVLAGIPSLPPVPPCWKGNKKPEQVQPGGQIKTKVSSGSLSQGRELGFTQR